jgi:hypothetical protein
MSNGKAFTVYVRYVNIPRSKYIDVNSDVLVEGNLQMELSSCIIWSSPLRMFPRKGVSELYTFWRIENG